MDAVLSTEAALRDLVRLVLGASWKEHLSPTNQNKAQKTQDRERINHPGAVPGVDLLDYSNFEDLKEIIEGAEEQFKEVFDDNTAFYLDIIRRSRNTLAHGRSLVPAERSLLEGASGLIRNQIALYRTQRQDSSAFYPVIESVTDHFGNRVSEELYNPPTLARMNVGEVLSLECRANDPRNRTLTWSIQIGSGYEFPYHDFAKGGVVRLRLPLRKNHVEEYLKLTIRIRNSSEYHRYSFNYDPNPYDDQIVMQYAVSPPL